MYINITYIILLLHESRYKNASKWFLDKNTCVFIHLNISEMVEFYQYVSSSLFRRRRQYKQEKKRKARGRRFRHDHNRCF